MTDQTPNSQQETILSLNETTLSLNIIKLLMEAKQPPLEGDLAIVRLVEWAQENHLADRVWLEAVLEAVEAAQQEDPEALYENLETPEIESATTLEQAATWVLRAAADLMPQDSEPA